MSFNRTLFNMELKNDFLNEKYPNESTRMTNASILRSVGRFELEKNKDLSKFSYEELKELLIGMNKKSIDSLEVSYTIIMQYLDWCLDKNYSSMNVLKLIDKEELPKYINQVAQKHSYFTRERLFSDVIDKLYNYVDKAMIAILFEGGRGRSLADHTFEELRNLKDTDINPEINVITVTRDNGEERDIKVSQKTMDILVAATKETEYHKLNGEGKGRFAIRPLKQAPYILRTLDVEFSDGDKITSSCIVTRFTKFREYTGIKFLNPTLVFQSGLLERCEEKEKEKGELQNEDFRQIYLNVNLDPRRWFSLKEMYEAFKKNKAPN